MRTLGYIALAMLAWFMLQLELAKLNPCSAFNDYPEICTQEHRAF